MLALLLFLLFNLGSASSGRTVYTQVTFMYDIKRGDIKAYNRPFSLYLHYFDQMLSTDSNLIVFGNKELAEFVWARRKPHNTVFVEKSLEEYRNYWYYPHVRRLREKFMSDPDFPYKNLPQFVLEDYNAIMLAKFYLLIQALKHDKFSTDILIWSDGGYMHIFPRNLVWPENVIKKYHQLVQAQWIFFTYFQEGLVLAGYQKGQYRYLDRKVEPYQLALAGHMGGYIQFLRDATSAFENFLRITLENGDMNSDESIVTMMPIRFPFLLATTSNIYLNNFVNKFHIYEDISKVPEHPRHFFGEFGQRGNLIIKSNQIIVQEEIKSVSKKNDSLPIVSLQLMDQLRDRRERQEISLRKIKSVVLKKLASQKKTASVKLAFFTVVVIIYLVTVIINLWLSKKANKVTEKILL